MAEDNNVEEIEHEKTYEDFKEFRKKLEKGSLTYENFPEYVRTYFDKKSMKKTIMGTIRREYQSTRDKYERAIKSDAFKDSYQQGYIPVQAYDGLLQMFNIQSEIIAWQTADTNVASLLVQLMDRILQDVQYLHIKSEAMKQMAKMNEDNRELMKETIKMSMESSKDLIANKIGFIVEALSNAQRTQLNEMMNTFNDISDKQNGTIKLLSDNSELKGMLKNFKNMEVDSSLMDSLSTKMSDSIKEFTKSMDEKLEEIKTETSYNSVLIKDIIDSHDVKLKEGLSDDKYSYETDKDEDESLDESIYKKRDSIPNKR